MVVANISGSTVMRLLWDKWEMLIITCVLYWWKSLCWYKWCYWCLELQTKWKVDYL